jgi:hypothetical protein
MTDRYILDASNKPVICPDLFDWAYWFETADRHVALDRQGDVEVSTVFLGLDHQFGIGPPLLFETMVFGGPLNEEQQRYSTWEEAVDGHQAMMKRAFP